MKKRFMFMFLFVFSSVVAGGKEIKDDKSFHNSIYKENKLTVGTSEPCPDAVGEELVKFYKKQVGENDEGGINILEIGAGTGNITEKIVEIIKDRPKDKLFVVECIDVFAELLREKFSEYKNVFIFEQKIEDWTPGKDDKIDFIISTIPVQSLSCAYTIIQIFDVFKAVTAENAKLSFVTDASWDENFKWLIRSIFLKLNGIFGGEYSKAMKYLEEFKNENVFEKVSHKDEKPHIYVYHANLNVV